MDPSSSAILPYPLQDTTSQWRRLWLEAVCWANKLDQRSSFERIWYHLQKVAWYYLDVRLIINYMSIWGVRHTPSKRFFIRPKWEKNASTKTSILLQSHPDLTRMTACPIFGQRSFFFANLGGIKQQYKFMVIFRDVLYYHAFFGVGHIMTPCC